MFGLACTEILDSILDGVYIVDRERRILYWNKGAEMLTGYAAAEVQDKRCMDNILNHVDDAGRRLCETQCPLVHTIHDGKNRQAEVFLHHKDGFRLPVQVKVSPLRADDGSIMGAVEIFSDNSAKIAAFDRIEKLIQESLIDPLTGVGNRRYAEITLRSRFDEKERYDWPAGVIVCDLDHFKAVNDRYGHDVGDQVLRMAAQTMTKAVRSFDFVGRWGGEEFLLCMPNIEGEAMLAGLAERIRQLIENSRLDTAQGPVSITASFGATLLAVDDTIESAYRRADELLYKSKREGRNRVSVG